MEKCTRMFVPNMLMDIWWHNKWKEVDASRP